MRAKLVLLWTLLTPAGFAQVPTLFDTVRPDATIVVTKHSVGSDIVEITMRDGNYPTAVLAGQAKEIGTVGAEAPRGLQVFREGFGTTGGEASFVKARFGVFGIIDRSAGTLDLQKIVRAMAKAPAESPVKGLTVIFDGEAPNATTLARYVGGGVSVEGRVNAQPRMIEYRVRIDTDNPESIVIPGKIEPTAPPKPTQPSGNSPEPLVIALIAVAALAVGALVYSLLLRTRPAGRR